MKKSEIRAEMSRLESRTKHKLRTQLEHLLDQDGNSEVPTKLNNSFLLDCYGRTE